MTKKPSFIGLFPDSKFETTPHDKRTDPTLEIDRLYRSGLEKWFEAEQMLLAINKPKN